MTTTATATTVHFARHLRVNDTIVDGLGEYDNGSVVKAVDAGPRTTTFVTFSTKWGRLEWTVPNGRCFKIEREQALAA